MNTIGWQCFLIILVAIFSMARFNVVEENDDIFKDLGLQVDYELEELEIEFDSLKVSYGSNLPLTSVKNEPTVNIPNNVNSTIPTKYYTLMMVDPDAPSRKNPRARVSSN